MNIFQAIRERIGAVIAAVFGSILVCICGALFTFYLAPQQALEANRIGNLPQMDASYVAAAAPGADILVTGSLVDNPPISADSQLVAYELEEWEVTQPSADSEDTTPDGSWSTVEYAAPDLALSVNGQTLQVLAAASLSFSGNLHEELVVGDGVETADYDGQPLPEGSLRYSGFYNGDLVTVLGTRATTGGVIPEKLYGGDRVAFEESEKDAATGLLIAGVVMLVCAPVVLIGGGLGAIFGRRQGRGFRMGRKI